MSERRNDAVRDSPESEHRSSPQGSQQASTTTSPTGEAKPTILVVEDRRSLADAYTHWFGDRFVVRTAASGADALEQFDDTVDVVLLDRGLPDVSGGEVLRTLREGGNDCAVIVVSAHEQNDEFRTLEYDHYFEKPISDPAAVIDVVESAIEVRAEGD